MRTSDASCINLGITNQDQEAVIYINCPDNTGQNCNTQANQLSLQITNNCPNTLSYNHASLSLQNVQLLNLNSINVLNNGYQLTATAISQYSPNITISAINQINIDSNTTLQLGLTNIDCYSSTTGHGRYTISFTFMDEQSETVSISSGISISYPPNNNQPYLQSTMNIDFVSADGGGRDGSSQAIYISNENNYNSDIPNRLVFSLQNSNKQQPINGTSNSYFTVSFVASTDDYSYGALNTQDLINEISLTHEEESYGAWDISFDNQLGNWKITPQNPYTILGIGINSISTFILDNIIANYQTGLTSMYISYFSIPGYNDGSFALPISKNTPQPTIVSFNTSKLYYNSCSLLSTQDQVVIFNYYLYGAQRWYLEINSVIGEASQKIFLDLCAENVCNQKGSITININDIYSLSNQYTYYLVPLNASFSKSVETFYINQCKTITASFVFPLYGLNYAGDVNADGIDDIGIFNQVIFGKKAFPINSSLSQSAKHCSSGLTIANQENENNNFLMAPSTSYAGDINADGISDLVLSGTNAYIIYGNQYIESLDVADINGNNGFAILMHGDIQHSAGMAGYIGDINADGIDDILVCGYFGVAYVIYGSKSIGSAIDVKNLNGSNGFSIIGDENMGLFLRSAGDVNGDKIKDIIIGCKDSAYVIYGSKLIPSTINVSKLDGSNGFSITGLPGGTTGHPYEFGTVVSSAGDFNDDGIDDMVLSTLYARYAPYYNPPYPVAYVIYGGASLGATINVNNLNGSNGFPLLGGDLSYLISVSNAGDINADGIDDIVIGNSKYEAAYVVYGSKNSPTSIDLTRLSNVEGFSIITNIEDFGQLVSYLGDINGDNSIDIGVASDSAVYIFSGVNQFMSNQYNSPNPSYDKIEVPFNSLLPQDFGLFGINNTNDINI
ncbi:FG-GAP repeat domain-containing protein [Candidatus Jidaibacter acanthamoebae]|nr:VCBS repeat-containing protein [Candidatus Jidaibacter acanthamoeba]